MSIRKTDFLTYISVATMLQLSLTCTSAVSSISCATFCGVFNQSMNSWQNYTQLHDPNKSMQTTICSHFIFAQPFSIFLFYSFVKWNRATTQSNQLSLRTGETNLKSRWRKKNNVDLYRWKCDLCTQMINVNRIIKLIKRKPIIARSNFRWIRLTLEATMKSHNQLP